MTNKEAIGKLKEILFMTGYKEAISLAIKSLEEQERPTGKWIDTGDLQEYWAEEYQCSLCGAKDHWHNYCPNCGAKMEEAENEQSAKGIYSR